MKLVSVSIIIPTLNRKKVLREALLSLNSVDYPRQKLEVVVVSDGSTDRTEKMVASIRKKLNYKLIFIQEKRKGISYAKNAAIKKAKGEIIISTDDDCLFEKDWLRKLTEPLSNPRVGCVGGPDRAREEEDIMAKSMAFAFSSFIGSGGIHGRFMKLNLGKYYPVGCNMAFRGGLVEKVGFFDEKIAPGEDTDFDHRVEKAGYRLVYVPKAFVWHRPKTSVRGFIPYIFKRGQARVTIVRRHFQSAELIYFLPAATVGVGTLLLFLSFFSPFFLKIFIFLFFLYCLLAISAGISAILAYRHWLYFFIVPVLIFIQHTLHGLGFWIAFLRSFFLKNEKTS